jgi:hypothetical protein
MWFVQVLALARSNKRLCIKLYIETYLINKTLNALCKVPIGETSNKTELGTTDLIGWIQCSTHYWSPSVQLIT